MAKVLVINADWIEFPDALENIARGRYGKDAYSNLHFEGKMIPNGVTRG